MQRIISRTKSLLALVRCLFGLTLHGPARQLPVSEPRRVLIVQSAKIGDMVCTTPVFRAIKEKYPKCEVWVLGNATNKALLEHNTDVDHYIIYEHEQDLDILVAKIHSWNLDAALLVTPEHRILSLLYLARVPLIVIPKVEGGWSPYETWQYKLLRPIAKNVPHHFGAYAPREYLRLLEPLGIQSTSAKKHLNFSPAAKKSAQEFLFHHGAIPGKDFIVGISPGAGNKIKTWGGERFAALAQHIYEKYSAKIVITGTEHDRAEVTAMLAHLKNVPAITALSVFSIDQLKAAISLMNMFIAVDTGPIYIAEAFGIPTIDIVGPMAEHEQPPISATNRVVVASRQAPELHIMNARAYDKVEARRQTEAITVDMVAHEFNSLYENLSTLR